jgi:hypothetical protein
MRAGWTLPNDLEFDLFSKQDTILIQLTVKEECRKDNTVLAGKLREGITVSAISEKKPTRIF